MRNLTQKRALKSLISSRTVRAYLLERQEYLRLHPDQNSDNDLIGDAIAVVLAASEPRAVSL